MEFAVSPRAWPPLPTTLGANRGPRLGPWVTPRPTLPQDGVGAALRRQEEHSGNAEAPFRWDQSPQHAELREGRDGDAVVQERVAARSSSASVPEDRAALGQPGVLGNTKSPVSPQLQPLVTAAPVSRVCVGLLLCQMLRNRRAFPGRALHKGLMSLPGSAREQGRLPAGQGGERGN